MGIEFLDPATGRIGSTTTERMNEEVKPSVAAHAEVMFNTRGRRPGKPFDYKFVKMMERIDATYMRKNPNGRTRNGL